MGLITGEGAAEEVYVDLADLVLVLILRCSSSFKLGP